MHPNTGRGVYGGRTLAQMRDEYPGVVEADFDTVVAEQDAHWLRPPVRITHERFIEMLEVLPPEDWQHHSGGESFKLSERTSGNVTMIFCRIGEDYYELQDRVTLTHAQILAKCEEV